MRDVKKEWLAVVSDKGRNMRTVWENLLSDEDVENIGDIWNIATIGVKAAHFATYPEELVRRCLSAGCPPCGKVLDMFLGSGTTLKVAKELGMDGIGIELNPEYMELARKRIAESEV